MEKNKTIRVVNTEATKKFIIEQEYTMGVCLSSNDIRGFKSGNVDISKAWGTIKGNELFIVNMKIKGAAEKDAETGKFREPERKLLEHRAELDKLIATVFKNKLAIVPLEAFTNEDGLMKIKIGLCKKNPEYVAPVKVERDKKPYEKKQFRADNGGRKQFGEKKFNGHKGGFKSKGGYNKNVGKTGSGYHRQG